MADRVSNRWGAKSAECIKQDVRNSIPTNTLKGRKYVWGQFSSFCAARQYELTAETSVEKLASILEDWAYNMKKSDGEDYKESVVKTLWNIVAKMLREKFYDEYRVTFNPFQDIVFKAARDARDAKRRELQVIPCKRKISAVDFTLDELNDMQNIWDEDTPDGLQRKFFHIVAADLAWRGGEAAHAVLESFVFEEDNAGIRTGRIQYNPVFSRTTEGRSRPCLSSKWLTPNVSNPNQCPVRLFNKLIQKRPPTITSNRVFLTPNRYWKDPRSKGWFKNSPVGRNEIVKWARQAAEKIGLDTKVCKITNHRPSIQVTAHASLARATAMTVTGDSDADVIETAFGSREGANNETERNIEILGDSVDFCEEQPPASPEFLLGLPHNDEESENLQCNYKASVLEIPVANGKSIIKQEIFEIEEQVSDEKNSKVIEKGGKVVEEKAPAIEKETGKSEFLTSQLRIETAVVSVQKELKRHNKELRMFRQQVVGALQQLTAVLKGRKHNGYV